MTRAAAAALALALALPLSAARLAAEAVEPQLHLSLEQGQALAAHALQNGDPALTLELSRALLQADRRNHTAWHLRAAAFAQTGQPAKGRKAAARAFRHAPDDASRYQLAQLASRLAYQSGRPTLSQYWLRRTATYAPDARAEQLIARDYKTLRRINPWSFRLSGGVKPSSNVNNGSDAATLQVDGLGSHQNRLGPRAIALSGLIGTLDAGISRRLAQNANSQTMLSARLYVQRVALSSSAKAKAQDAAARTHTTVPRNADFGSTYGELTLAHAFRAGPADSGGSARVALTAATSWYGGERSYDLAKLSASRSWVLSPQMRLTLSGSAEHRIAPQRLSLDANVLGLGAALTRELGNGDRVDVSLGLRDTRAKSKYFASQTTTLRLGYAFDEQVGPARVSTGLILGNSAYPDQIVYTGSAWQPVPGGRTDRSAYADLNLFFADYDYAGFAPQLRLRAGRRFSNLSKYDSSEFSVSLGIQSKF